MTSSHWLDLAALIVFAILVAAECGAIAWIYRKARRPRPPERPVGALTTVGEGAPLTTRKPQ